MSSPADLAQYAVARTVSASVGSLPPSISGRSGELLGGLVRILGMRRGVAERQVAAAFPGASPDWVAATVRGCYRHFGREMVATARLYRAGPALLPVSLRLDAPTSDHVDRMKAGRAAIIVLGHLGNWELGGAYLASLGVPVAAVVKRQSNSRFDAWLQEARRKVGIRIVYAAGFARRAPGLLRSGTSIALVADQAAGPGGEIVTFMGRPASTFRGPAILALATGAPMLYASFLRERESYRATLERCPVPDESAGLARRAKERRLTEDWVRRLEASVKEDPTQYLWSHRRWKMPNGEGTA